MSLKNSCSLISSAPCGPDPILRYGFRFKRLVRRDFAAFERKLGNFRAAFYMLFKSSTSWSLKYGGSPTSISYSRTPNKYQSTDLPCPLLFNISGARYAKLPQKLLASVLS
jgi:hypothetical protein